MFHILVQCENGASQGSVLGPTLFSALFINFTVCHGFLLEKIRLINLAVQSDNPFILEKSFDLRFKCNITLHCLSYWRNDTELLKRALYTQPWSSIDFKKAIWVYALQVEAGGKCDSREYSTVMVLENCWRRGKAPEMFWMHGTEQCRTNFAKVEFCLKDWSKNQNG